MKITPFASKCGATRLIALRAIDAITGEARGEPLPRLPIYPKSHYVLPAEQKERAIRTILEELNWWKPELEKQGKYASERSACGSAPLA